MVKDEEKKSELKPVAPSARSSKSLFESSAKPATEVAVAEPTESKTIVDTAETEEPKTLPKIRLRVEEEAGKVKQFATAQGLSMHIKVNKAKRAGLGALHKMATWLTPKKK